MQVSWRWIAFFFAAYVLGFVVLWKQSRGIEGRLEAGASRPPAVARFTATLADGEVVSLEVPSEVVDGTARVFSSRAARVWLEFLAQQRKERER